MVGLFVTALVGLYTIEDLWEKFGDLRMSVVSFIFLCIYNVQIELAHIARSSETLGRPYSVSHHCSNPRVHGIVQTPLHGP